MNPVAPVAISHRGRRILLKWHKLRQAADEPPFSRANLRAGLAAGASLEIDARVLADGEWVCLHDDALDEETDGTGAVGSRTSQEIRRLKIAGGDYAPPLLAEIAADVAAAPAAGALLQIDLKEPFAGLSDRAVARFAEIIAPVAGACLLSGAEWPAVARLAVGVPGLRLGYDPYEVAGARAFSSADEIATFVDETLATAPDAAAFYLYHAFVDRALSLGVNPVDRLKENGALVDVWTLDATTPGIRSILPRAIAAGADQITTNGPAALAALWASLAED